MKVEQINRRFVSFKNVLVVYSFYLQTINWLTELFFHEQIQNIIILYEDEFELVDTFTMEIICKTYAFLSWFKEIMQNDVFSEERKV